MGSRESEITTPSVVLNLSQLWRRREYFNVKDKLIMSDKLTL